MQIGGLFSRVGACKHSPKSPTCSKNIGKLSKVPTLLNRPLFIQCPYVHYSVFNTMYKNPSII